MTSDTSFIFSRACMPMPGMRTWTAEQKQLSDCFPGTVFWTTMPHVRTAGPFQFRVLFYTNTRGHKIPSRPYLRTSTHSPVVLLREIYNLEIYMDTPK